MLHCAISIAVETRSQQSFVAPIIKFLECKIIGLPYIFPQTLVGQTWLACIIIQIFSFPCTSSGKSEIVKLLLSRGADVDGKPEVGTPLNLAALRGHESTVEVLLEYHADVQCLDHLLKFVLSSTCH
jgi:hypothetical protein